MRCRRKESCGGTAGNGGNLARVLGFFSQEDRSDVSGWKKSIFHAVEVSSSAPHCVAILATTRAELDPAAESETAGTSASAGSILARVFYYSLLKLGPKPRYEKAVQKIKTKTKEL